MTDLEEIIKALDTLKRLLPVKSIEIRDTLPLLAILEAHGVTLNGRVIQMSDLSDGQVKIRGVVFTSPRKKCLELKKDI